MHGTGKRQSKREEFYVKLNGRKLFLSLGRLLWKSYFRVT